MSSLSFFLYLFFMCSWFLHITARIPVLATIRLDMLLVAAIGAMAYATRPKNEGRLIKLLFVLLAYIILTTPLVEWPGSVVRSGLITLTQALVFYFFTSWLVTSEQRLRLTMIVFVLCQVIRVLEPVYLHQTEGYWGSRATMAGFEELERLAGSPYDVVNPNGLAFVMLTAFCFMHYLWPLSRLGTVAYIVVLPISLYALALTGSRSGLVGLFAAFGAIFLRSHHKMALAAAATTIILAAVPYLGPDLADRYLSIVSSHTRNAETVEYRVSGVQGDLIVGLRRPLFGHGLGTSREANANFRGIDQPSHNLYTEIFQELGIGGLIIFVMILVAIVANLRMTIRQVRAGPERRPYILALANALNVWMALNVIFSFASYGLSNYTWYFMAGISEALLRLTQTSEAVAPVSVASRPAISAGLLPGVAMPVQMPSTVARSFEERAPSDGVRPQRSVWFDER